MQSHLSTAVHRALGVFIAAWISACGSLPGPGPTQSQIDQRTRGLRIDTYRAPDGKDLAYVTRLPRPSNPRHAAFIYVHGIESHSGWFDEAARLLNRRGYPVFCLDRRGSGINRENRGFISGHAGREADLLEDLHRAVRDLRSSGKVGAIYLIGLSWGGKYAVAYDVRHPQEVDGLVLITPGIKPAVDLNLREKAAVFTDAVFAPERQHSIPIQPEMFTTTPRFLDYITNDPLRLHTVSAGFLMQSHRMDKLLGRHGDESRTPALLFLAGHDRIINNDETRRFFANRQNLKIIEYPDQTHSIQLDAPDRLTRDIIAWVEATHH
jgi:acylglycerol lipase